MIMNPNAAHSTADREIVLSRVLDAPRELVWEAWTDPKHLIQWWGPDGFTNTFHEIDIRPGGVWRFMMHGPDGTDYPNKIVFEEIVKHEKLVYDHSSDLPEGQPDPHRFHATVTFEEQRGKTALTMRLLCPTVEQREEKAKFAIEGGKQTLGRLAAHLEMMI